MILADVTSGGDWRRLEDNAMKIPDVDSSQVDPYTPAFINVSELNSSGWGETMSTDTLAAPQEAQPLFEQGDGGRGKYEKRQEIIECIKLKSSYKEYLLILEQGEELPCEVPGTPNPRDVDISKRKWESLVSKWRAALRQVEKIRNGQCDETDQSAV